MSKVKVDKTKLKKLAKAVKKHNQVACALVDRLAGEHVKKEAMSTIEELSSVDALPELEHHQKEAYADNFRFDPTRAMSLLRKFAQNKRELEDQIISSDVGETVDKEASASHETESDRIWSRMDRLM